jgi:predicted dienelactone hydrolase
MRVLIFSLFLVLAGAPGHAAPMMVGETHREADQPSAAARDAAHRPQLRITIWYPAAAGSVEQPIVIGPDAHPIFLIGNAAMNAAPATGKRPVILLSHGFGGTARIMGWFGIAMARAGFVVVAVDHPGNNGLDPMTVPGALLTWERAGDLRRALQVALEDKVVGPHMDANRIGLAGFSAGGFTALVGAGARVDLNRFRRFCAAQPEDGVCRPQREFPVTAEQRDSFEQDPAFSGLLRHAGDDHSIPNVRAVFAMAPAIVQALTPESLRRIHVPVAVIFGADDVVAPPQTNGEVAARLVPGAQRRILAGVGHYNFLADCAPDVHLPLCGQTGQAEDAHAVAIGMATRLFQAMRATGAVNSDVAGRKPIDAIRAMRRAPKK